MTNPRTPRGDARTIAAADAGPAPAVLPDPAPAPAGAVAHAAPQRYVSGTPGTGDSRLDLSNLNSAFGSPVVIVPLSW